MAAVALAAAAKGEAAAATSETGPAAAAAVAAAGTLEVVAPCDSPAGASSPRRGGGSGTEGPDPSHAARDGVLAGAGESQPACEKERRAVSTALRSPPVSVPSQPCHVVVAFDARQR